MAAVLDRAESVEHFEATPSVEQRAIEFLEAVSETGLYIPIDGKVMLAVERLIDEDERKHTGFVAELLHGDKELATTIFTIPFGKRALPLVSTIRARAQKQLAEAREQIRAQMRAAISTSLYLPTHRGSRTPGKTEKRNAKMSPEARKRQRSERDLLIREAMKNGGKGRNK